MIIQFGSEQSAFWQSLITSEEDLNWNEGNKKKKNKSTWIDSLCKGMQK